MRCLIGFQENTSGSLLKWVQSSCGREQGLEIWSWLSHQRVGVNSSECIIRCRPKGFQVHRGMKVSSIVSGVQPFISSVVLKFSLFYILPWFCWQVDNDSSLIRFEFFFNFWHISSSRIEIIIKHIPFMLYFKNPLRFWEQWLKLDFIFSVLQADFSELFCLHVPFAETYRLLKK